MILPAALLLATAATVVFEEIARQAGIDFTLRNGAAGRHWQVETMVGGVVAFDYDNDGRIDLFFVNGDNKPPAGGHRLYRNVGGGRFEDVTARSGLRGQDFMIGGAAADYDNDGLSDLFMAGVGRNFLYRNRGGTFEDVTGKAGLGRTSEWSVSAGWFDYDADGFLDLFIVNYVDWSPEKDPPCTTGGIRTYCHPRYYTGLPNRLYRNNGDGTFSDVSRASGIAAHIGKGMGLAFLDFDGDGRLDVFVANDTVPNFLFRNEGKGQFREVALRAGVAFNEDGRALSSMGVDARDLDNDGREDLWITANANETFPLFMNLGRGLFRDETYPAGLGRETMRFTGWSNGIFDFNNDGRKDLFAACGAIDYNTEQFSHRTSRQTNQILLNAGEGKFAITASGGMARQAGLHRGAAFADFDGDGRIDIAVSRIGEPAAIYRNVSETGNHWLAVQLSGVRANRSGIGAMIRVRGASGTTQWNRVTTATGYASSSPPAAHFGMGGDTRAAEVEVLWPGGEKQIVRDVGVDRVLTITQPDQ